MADMLRVDRWGSEAQNGGNGSGGSYVTGSGGIAGRGAGDNDHYDDRQPGMHGRIGGAVRALYLGNAVHDDKHDGHTGQHDLVHRVAVTRHTARTR
jgi:hypothetical protein